MLRSIFFSTFGILLTACAGGGPSPAIVIETLDDFEDSVANEIVKKFSLPYSIGLKADGNSLIFYRLRYDDTSSLIQMRSQKDAANVVFYTVLRDNHTSLNDYANAKNNLLFFEGCSFTIDSLTWQKVRTYAQTIVDSDSSPIKNVHLLDGSKYALYYNTLKKIGNSTNEEVFENFYNFLDSMMLRQCNNRRTYKLIKADSSN